LEGIKMIAVVGSTNMDIVMTVEHFTKPGETQKAEKLELFPGGKGANQAVTVAKLLGSCYFLSYIGNDEYGDFYKDYFMKLNISGFKVVNGQTGRAFIELTKEGENRIIIVEGTNGMLTKESIDENLESLLKNDFVLLQNEIPFETTYEVAKRFKEKNKTVIFDPAPARGIDLRIMKFVDFLTPNETEISELLKSSRKNVNSIDEAFEILKKFGLKNLIVKMGEKGVIFKSDHEKFTINALRVKVKDTTAAGDVFNGSFAVALQKNMNLKKALEFANAAAAISVTRKGAQPSIPTYEEVEKFLKSQN
jgi:ribokinase